MIFLVRHGQTDWNLLKKFNGSTDIELNQTGITQAKSQSEKMNGVNFDTCFCSPQKRARQTCEIIFKGPIMANLRNMILVKQLPKMAVFLLLQIEK